MKKLIQSIILTFGTLAAMAQGVDQLPTNPGDGKCYAKCVEPDEYKEEIQKVMVKPSYKTLEVVPAEYKTVTKTIVLTPASKKFIYVPATYKTVVDTVWTKENYNKLTVKPAEFSDAKETVELKSNYGKWVAGDKDPDCPSINPEDCRVFHYKAIPAVTKDFPTKKLVKDELTDSKEIIGKYILVPRKVELEPASYKEEVIAQQTKEVSQEVLVKNETTREKVIPAEYIEVKKNVLVKAGGMTLWKEVPCTIPDDAIVLPINWNVGSSVLTSTAQSIIDKKLLPVAQTGKNNIIEIGSHTDSRGSDVNNQSLSEKRAKAVAEYLISKGIEKNRLVAVGYGETRLKNNCADGVDCSESKHAVNRRTEFKVY
jgi:OmpA-OmpF porin, OOP family